MGKQEAPCEEEVPSHGASSNVLHGEQSINAVSSKRGSQPDEIKLPSKAKGSRSRSKRNKALETDSGPPTNKAKLKSPIKNYAAGQPYLTGRDRTSSLKIPGPVK